VSIRSNYDLRRWLAKEILGKDLPRKPSKKASFLHPNKPARDWTYRAWIRSLPSAISGLSPCDACHTGTDGGMRLKASDYSCIPLTREEHMEYHRIGQRAFASKYGLNILNLVKRLNDLWFTAKAELRRRKMVAPAGKE
jgi:hypothetical protein